MQFWAQFKRLLKNSVITGIPQIITTRNICKKSLKIIVFICCMIGFFWQTFSFLTVYWTYPTVVDVDYHFPDEFELPAVSVCSYNSIKADRFCDRFPNLCYPNTSLDAFCEKNTYFCDPNHESPGNESYPTVTPRELPDIPRAEYAKMGIQAEEMVIRCVIYDAPNMQDCTRQYQNVSVFDTKGLPSNCYAYNSLWGKTKGAEIIRTQTFIILFLKTDKTFTTQFYTSSPFSIQMSLHNPYTILNPFRNGFSINPCSNYYIFPSKQINKLLPPPYTSACYNYTKSWLNRSGKGPLTKRLCSEECILNRSLEAVKCVDPFHIFYPNTEKICRKETDRNVYRPCIGYCRPSCMREEITVDVQEHSHFSPRGIHKEDACHSTVIIAFNRMELVKYSYSAKYESVSLFSYIGGYLGLWLGISLVAICDVIETAVLLVQWIVDRCRKRRQLKSRIQSHTAYSGTMGDMRLL